MTTDKKCDICEMDNKHFILCVNKHEICEQCFELLSKNRCPFCRVSYDYNMYYTYHHRASSCNVPTDEEYTTALEHIRQIEEEQKIFYRQYKELISTMKRSSSTTQSQNSRIK